ncbi:MAG: aminotransferase class I/II-fold pyridoxal phosphate-dependent enzyme [Gemmatimonadota bacterium]
MNGKPVPSVRPSASAPPQPASRLDRLPAYPLADVPALRARLEAEGKEVIDLGAGDSGLPVPEQAVAALSEAVRRPELQRYAFQRGLPELREAIAEWMEKRYGRRLDPYREILPLIGSKEGVGHAALAILDPGDGALVPDPGYAAYFGGALFAGAHVQRVLLRDEEDFLVPPDAIRAYRGRLRLVYLNYPNNPTGATADADYLQRILEATRERGALLVYDNAYAEIAFDGYRPPSLLELDGGLEFGLEFHSFSKTFNMTGWRLGWVCGSAEMVGALSRAKSFFDTGIYLGIQAAGAAVLRDPEPFLSSNVARLRERRDAAVVAFRKAGFPVRAPRATLYLWLPVPTAESSEAFARRVLLEEGVVLLPGSALGAGGEGFLRVAFTLPPDRYAEAASRVGRQL